MLKPCLSAPAGCRARGGVHKGLGGNQLRLEQAGRAAAPGVVPEVTQRSRLSAADTGAACARGVVSRRPDQFGILGCRATSAEAHRMERKGHNTVCFAFQRSSQRCSAKDGDRRVTTRA